MTRFKRIAIKLQILTASKCLRDSSRIIRRMEYRLHMLDILQDELKRVNTEGELMEFQAKFKRIMGIAL